MKKNLDGFIEKATENIVEDRAATKTLLLNLMQYIQTGDDKHREFGLIAAKYLETLQRSNEQLVKLASLLQKQQRGEEEKNKKDRQDLFDMINSSEEDG